MDYTEDQLTQLATQFDPSGIATALSRIPAGSVMSPTGQNSLGMDYSKILQPQIAPGETGGAPTGAKPMNGLDPKTLEAMMSMAGPKIGQPHFMGAASPRVQQVNMNLQNPSALAVPGQPVQPVSPLAAILHGGR